MIHVKEEQDTAVNQPVVQSEEPAPGAPLISRRQEQGNQSQDLIKEDKNEKEESGSEDLGQLDDSFESFKKALEKQVGKQEEKEEKEETQPQSPSPSPSPSDLVEEPTGQPQDQQQDQQDDILSEEELNSLLGVAPDKAPTDQQEEPTEDQTQQPADESDLDPKIPKPESQPHGAETRGRDYSFAEDPRLKKLFRQMSNSAFEFSKDLYLKHKQAQETIKTLKGNYLRANESAYTLTPEYQEVSKAQVIADAAEEAWKDQLAALEDGNEAYNIVYDQESGELVYGEKLEPNGASKVLAQTRLQKAQQLRAALNQKEKEIQSRHINELQSYKETFERVDQTLFGDYEPPEEAVNEVAEHIPQNIRGLPEVAFGIKAYAALSTALSKYRKLLATFKHYVESGQLKTGGGGDVNLHPPSSLGRQSNNEFTKDDALKRLDAIISEN